MASPQRRQLKRPSQPLRSVSKALRTLGTSEDIQCTKTLIEAYNADSAGDANGIALHHWLEAYVDEFSEWKAECVHDSRIREYALLAMIKVKTSAAAELLRRVYVSLRACIKVGEYCSPVIVVALDDMLRVMDVRIIEKETQSLFSLADDLLILTDPKKNIFTRDTYPVLMACLLTLERILIVLHGVECAHSKQWIVYFFQTRLKEHLKGIKAKAKYYPFVYNTQLIKHNINGLIDGNPTSLLLNGGRRAFFALCGGLYLFQAIRELAVMRLDFAAMEAGVRKMHHAFSGILDTKVPGLQEVFHAASEVERTNDFNHIMKCYKKHERPSFRARVSFKRLKIVKFSLISHLTLFASENFGRDLSDEAFRLLSELAVNDDTKQWRADSDTYESLLDALASVGAKRHPLRHDCLQLLHQMENSSIQNQQTVMDWRGYHTIEQKLDMLSDNKSEVPNPSLYDTVRERMNLHVTHKLNLEHKQELIEHYQDESFTQVSLLLDDVTKRHVVDFDFHNVVYELVDAEDHATNIVNSTDEDQMTHNMERSRRVQTPIKLRDIFAGRRQKPFGPEEDVNRVLLLGNPGTGKTSLSKKLCHDWTTGEWGSEFDRVYLLQVRQLTGSRFQFEQTVEAAIALLLLNAHHKPEDERKALHRQIKDELDEQTTLLVIDGLDEANGNDVAEAIVEDGVSRPCSILVLSRPHNLGDLRSKVDIEIECLGLNEDQLKAYVRKEVPSASDELIQFIKKSPLVWETLKVPVNVEILCRLWNTEEGQSLKELKSLNLKSLYSAMTLYAWKRFVDKTRGQVNRQEVFSSLEIIAFKSISQSKIEIPLDLVMEYSQGATTEKIFCDSGFLLFQKEGQVFQFAHLSFHEFFAGRYLAKMLRGSEREIKRAKKYITEHKYLDTSRVTLAFMTQCYCQEEEYDEKEDCIECLKELFSILDEDPVEVVGFQHILLRMRTLDAFLSILGNCVEDIRLDEELLSLVEYAKRVLNSVFLDLANTTDVFSMFASHSHSKHAHIYEELGRMPSLLAYLPEFLRAPLGNRAQWYIHEDISNIARLVSYNPGALLQIVPKELRGDASYEDPEIPLNHWLKLFAEAGPECAVLALERLKTLCQIQDSNIRKEAFRAVPSFLKVLPEEGNLHSLCMTAMKDASGDVRQSFMKSLGSTRFEPNSAAANLAWKLTMEATRDFSRSVQGAAIQFVVRDDVTSEESIEKMIALVQKFTPMSGRDLKRGSDEVLIWPVCRLLRRFPTTLTAFLPYLERCCFDSDIYFLRWLEETILELSAFLPTPQKRELGQMISRIYCDVKDPELRRGLVTVLYDIGQKVPDFMAEFQAVYSEACRDPDHDVRKLAIDKETVIELGSTEGVHAINEVFWDQSFEVKKELLCHIQQESLVNAETAEVVMEMAADCMQLLNGEIERQSIDVLSSVTRIRSLNNKALCRVLDYEETGRSDLAFYLLNEQPLDRLIEYFLGTKDERVIGAVCKKFITASVTYKADRGGNSIVSIVERGKKTEQEVPTELAEELIKQVRRNWRPHLGDLLF